MTTATKQVLKDALTLSSIERATLVDQLLSTLDEPDDSIDNFWRREVEERIDAYSKGNIKSVSLKNVLSKYQI